MGFAVLLLVVNQNILRRRAHTATFTIIANNESVLQQLTRNEKTEGSAYGGRDRKKGANATPKKKER